MINRRTLIVLIITFVYALCAGAALTWVVSQNMKLGQQMSEQVQVIANAIAQEQQYIELDDLIESSEPMRASLDSLVLTEERTIDFLAQIETIGREQGVSLETQSLAVVETEGVFDTLTIDFKIEGTEGRVLTMMRIMESLPYHSELESVRISNDTETGVSTMNVTLLVSLLAS